MAYLSGYVAVSGHQAAGPFPSAPAASAWVDGHLTTEQYTVLPLFDPEQARDLERELLGLPPLDPSGRTSSPVVGDPTWVLATTDIAVGPFAGRDVADDWCHSTAFPEATVELPLYDPAMAAANDRWSDTE